MTRSPQLAALLAGLVIAQAASGCLSNQYRISKGELARMASLPPEARGGRVRVVQQMGSPDGDPVPYAPPPAPAAAAPPGWQPEPAWAGPPHGPAVTHDVYVGVELGGGGGGSSSGSAVRGSVAPGWRGETSGAARPMNVAPPAPAVAAPSPGPGGGVGVARAGGGAARATKGGGGGDELAVVAVVMVAVAVMAVAGVAITEGMRYDGFAQVSPWQPLHLRYPDGTERVTTVGALTPEDAAVAEAGLVYAHEAYGIGLLGRAPLDRKGFAFKVDVGGMQGVFDEYNVAGLASNVQLGYFPHQRFGLLGTLSIASGADDAGDSFARLQGGLEAQLFPIGWKRLHLGTYLNLSRPLASGGVTSAPGTSIGGGAILEIELATRLALTGRIGPTTTRLDGGGWSRGVAGTVGLAVY